MLGAYKCNVHTSNNRACKFAGVVHVERYSVLIALKFCSNFMKCLSLTFRKANIIYYTRTVSLPTNVKNTKNKLKETLS